MGDVYGEVAPGFERVKEAFAANFEHNGEVGAACSAYHRGEKVVDLWGGVADPESGRPWAEDSIMVVASSTKGATAICANLLVQRGELDQPLAIEDFLAWEPPVQALAGQRPVWEPGTTHGYHAMTYGWLVGEVVRRISGKSLGTFFADEVAGPLGLDFWIGLPASEERRVSPMIEIDLEDPEIEPKGERAAEMLEAATDAESYLTREQTTTPLELNSRAFRAAELPAANGITDARSLARMYAGLIGAGVDGVRLFTDETVRRASTALSDGRDEVMGIRSRFGPGFYLYLERSNMVQDGVFGHGGAGGSIGYADPRAELGFGYVMNKMQMVGDDDPRTVSLARAVHESLKG